MRQSQHSTHSCTDPAALQACSQDSMDQFQPRKWCQIVGSGARKGGPPRMHAVLDSQEARTPNLRQSQHSTHSCTDPAPLQACS